MLIVGGLCVCCAPPPGGGHASIYPFPNLHPIVRPPNLLIACTILPSSHSAPTAYLPLHLVVKFGEILLRPEERTAEARADAAAQLLWEECKLAPRSLPAADAWPRRVDGQALTLIAPLPGVQGAS